MTTIDVLRAARKRIADPKHWTQKALCRDAKGSEAVHLPDAACWCAMGAIAASSSNEGEWNAARWALESACPSDLGLVQFNDSRTHAEVLALFDRTIARLEAKR